MAAALKAASQMGYIEKSQTKAKSSGLQELKAQKFSIEDKSRYILNSTDVYVFFKFIKLMFVNLAKLQGTIIKPFDMPFFS